MAFDYVDLASTATELIEEFGAPVVLEQVVGAEYNTGTSEVEGNPRRHDGKAVRIDYDLSDIDGNDVRVGDFKLLLSVKKANGEEIPMPRNADRMLFDGQWTTVVSCKPVKPATVAVAYEVQVRI
jgi:hypothetical protein